MTFIKGGSFLLLLLACAVLAEHHKPMGKDNRHFKIVKSLMKECQAKGYAAPKQSQLEFIFSSSDESMENGDNEPPKTLAQIFLHVLDSVNEDKSKAGHNQFPVDAPDKMRNKMWNCSNLPIMVKKINSSSESTACYLRAFMAPLCLAALMTQCDDLDSDDHQALLWCARIIVPEKPLLKLSSNIKEENFKPMMEMLQSLFNSSSDSDKTQVARWAKEQILQNKFNCTTKPSDSSSRKGIKDRCKSQVKWLDSEKMNILGCFSLYFTSEDIASSPKEKLCELIRLGCFKSLKDKPKPSWAKMFLQKYKECFPGEELQEHVDELGPLACYLDDDLVSKVIVGRNSTSSELLHQFEHCHKPTMRKRMKQFVNLLLSNASNALKLQDLHEIMHFLSQKQISALPDHILDAVLKIKSLKWTRGQECLLVRKQNADKCDEMSVKNLTVLQSLLHGLPVCIFKKLKAEEFLEDLDAHEGWCETMTKAQLQALMKEMIPYLLKKRLPRCLPCIASLISLQNKSINSLDEVEKNTWCKTQAAYWVKKTEGKLPVFEKLRSSIQGFGCEWIEKLNKSVLLEWVKAITNNSQWLSKSQARCSANAFFKTKNENYFKTITEEELEAIPTFILLFLRQELPDSVCPTFIEKMGKADLSLLPNRERSRRTLADKALHCVANGRKLSELTKEDVHKLGSMLCDQSPSNLKLLTEEVLTETFELLANCSNIFKAHMTEMKKLLQAIGNSSTWTPEKMEKFGVLVVKDDEALFLLPNRPWLKDVLYFLSEKIPAPSEALKKKVFELVTNISLTAADSGEAAPDGQVRVVLTENLVEELGPSNCYWPSTQLDTMTVSTFEATVETLGECPSYRADQLAVLTKKAIEVFGPVSQMDRCQLVQLHCIARGFSNSDLELLPFSLSSLKDMVHCGYTESQMESVWKGIAKRYNLTVQMLDATDIVELNQFISGLSASEIAQLDVESFRNAVGQISCFELSDKKKQQLRNLIVAVFGDPSTWSEAQVSALAIIIPHLTEGDCATLKENVLPFLRKSCISLISPLSFKKFSENQLKAFGPDNAEMVTSSQHAMLSAKQLAALEEAETGSDELVLNSVQSRAPLLNVEGVVAFSKPLLFFFMGFMLL
ncbi:uncharacterized protein otoa [Gouania willdenowi]|uniref:uncharacterized protein otoa n=1 Tax=Gouania willdenowi TaxID=441366 RepID=UPI001055C6F5|nr:uncharacterized protein LOC114478065 [Gouania willdenowi]